MPSPATAPIEAQPDSVANLDFYRTRDEFVRAYSPATAEEQILVVQITRAWLHLQQIYQLHAQITAGNGLLSLFNDDFGKYKILMRDLSSAERMWHHAVQQLQRARRTRDPLGSRRAHPLPQPEPASHNPAPSLAHDRQDAKAESDPPLHATASPSALDHPESLRPLDAAAPQPPVRPGPAAQFSGLPG